MVNMKDDNEESEVVIGDFHLLAIGIDTYDNHDNLNGAVNGAEAICEILQRKYGFKTANSVFIPEENADSEVIHSAIRAYIDDDPNDEYNTNPQKAVIPLTEDDYLLIWFSGHGERDKKIYKSTFFVPKDGDKKSTSNWISHTRFLEYIDEIKARKVLLISDSCFSGGIFQTRKLNYFFKKFISRKELKSVSRQAITSGRLELVPDLGDRIHSYFSRELLNVLEENKEPVIDASSITSKIKKRLQGFNHIPTPVIGNLACTNGSLGEFLFFNQESVKSKFSENIEQQKQKIIGKTTSSLIPLRVVLFIITTLGVLFVFSKMPSRTNTEILSPLSNNYTEVWKRILGGVGQDFPDDLDFAERCEPAVLNWSGNDDSYEIFCFSDPERWLATSIKLDADNDKKFHNYKFKITDVGFIISKHSTSTSEMIISEVDVKGNPIWTNSFGFAPKSTTQAATLFTKNGKYIYYSQIQDIGQEPSLSIFKFDIEKQTLAWKQEVLVANAESPFWLKSNNNNQLAGLQV